MWKKVGSVQSGDHRSQRSNKSREDITLEPFHQSLKRRSNVSPDGPNNRSFCFDFLEKKKEDRRNMTMGGAGSKSEKSLKLNDSVRDDIFTSMRNVLKDDKEGFSKLDSKHQHDSSVKNPEAPITKISYGGKTAMQKNLAQLKQLKRDQKNLKKAAESEFNAVKNMLYQLEDVLHTQRVIAEGGEEAASAPTEQPKSQEGQEELQGILEEAMGV